MKILHVINNLQMGGGQNLLIGLTDAQKSDDVSIAELIKSDDSTIRDKIEANGINVFALKSSGSPYNPLLIFKLIRIIKQYDIVHVHLFPALYWAGVANLLSCRKVNLVYTEHSTKNRRRNKALLRLTDTFIYKYCYKKIIACADKALETFKNVYPDVQHVCAINNGVNTQKYHNAQPYSKQELLGIPNNCFVTTMVARFMTMKRQDILVKALCELPARFHICLVGGEASDEGLQKVKQLALKLNVADRVHFLYIRPDVDRILKTSDAVAMISEYEGLSLSSIEGMAAGKPFIASDVDGLREVVKDAGVLFQLNDVNQLSQIILKLGTNRDYYAEIAEKCLLRASEYDIRNMAEQYSNVYHEVVK